MDKWLVMTRIHWTFCSKGIKPPIRDWNRGLNWRESIVALQLDISWSTWDKLLRRERRDGPFIISTQIWMCVCAWQKLYLRRDGCMYECVYMCCISLCIYIYIYIYIYVCVCVHCIKSMWAQYTWMKILLQCYPTFKERLYMFIVQTDDTAFVAHSHEDMQEIVPHFTSAAKAFGLQVKIKKMEMLFQPSPGTDDHHRCILISGEDLLTVKEFKCLGSTATYNNKLDTELRLRKSKASQAFGRLKDKVWFNKDLTIKTKCAVYSAIVLSNLLYGAESWTVYMAQAHSLNAYMMRHLRQILGVKWWHRIPNQDILMKTNMSSTYETLIHRNLRWAGHLIRLDNTRVPILSI